MRASAGLTFEVLEPRLQMAVVINEFLASNTNGLMDQDGDRSDWIELYNDGPAAVDLTGWHLTDDEQDLVKWTLPATNLAAGGYLVIFASGKDRTVAGQELHTNFALEQNGESLLLVMPDGATVVDSFAPLPEQLPNVSYGRGSGGVQSEPLVDETETVRVKVPTSVNDVVGTTWTQLGYNDTSWIQGDTAIGYERSPGGTVEYTSYFQMDVNTLMPSAQNRDTIYMRISFNVAEIAALQNLTLLMRYDDGFVAYLNGQKIAERNAPATPAWNSQATTTHPDTDAIVYEPIDVSAHLADLQEGSNVLAIHGLNRSTSRSDFLIGPMLVVDRVWEPVTGYMVTPTPGAANVQGTLGFVADTKFSTDRGLYTAPFHVSITTATDGAVIRYTLDGSEPTDASGLIYNPLSPPLITTTTTLRAAAFKTGFTPSNIDTQTYIFLDDVIQQDGSGLPAYAPWSHFSTLGIADGDWEMDPDVVSQYAGTIKDDLRAVDSISVVMPWNALFGSGGQGIYISGQNVERRGSVELIPSAGGEPFQIDAAVEIAGGTSVNRWNNDKLSMRITFKVPFGPTDLEYPLFTDPFFDVGASDEFDTLLLDAVYNHSWAYGGTSTPQQQRDTAKFIQDQFVADLQNLAGGHAPHGRYVHLYLNGLYWGMYYLHERPDESFAAEYLGGDKDDYDVLKHNQTDVVHGDTTAVANYEAMLNLVRQDLTIPANYQAAAALVDIDDLITYIIVNYYVGNEDWSHQNWYASYNRADPNGKWRYHSWDAEHVLENINYNAIFNGGYTNGPEEVHQRMMANEEYRLRFVDHVQRLFFNGGRLSPQSVASIYAARAAHVERALVGESARWGDNQREPAYTLPDWQSTLNDLLNNYFPQRGSVVLNQFGAQQWRVTLAAPLINQFGGTVDPGFAATLSKPVGAPVGARIYYTLDGTDPRDPATNQPRSSALEYVATPIIINAKTQIKARIWLDEPGISWVNEWSPLIDPTFQLPTPFGVRITELHYNPAARAGVADKEDMEFIELTNTSGQTIDLSGVRITEFSGDGITIGPGYELAPGERLIVARNPAVFQQVYGPGYNVFAAGYANANLSNGGEWVVLLGPMGETLQDFTYGDSGTSGWPSSPDGGGPSLEIVDWLGNPSDPANWRASQYEGGSPGASGVAGDYDGNGVVTASDYTSWLASYGGTVGVGSRGDGNRDGTVDTADYLVWRKALTPAAGGSAETFAVDMAPATEPGDGSRLVGRPQLSESPSPEDQLPLLLAVDHAFARFAPSRPANRPAGAIVHTVESDVGDLLLAGLTKGFSHTRSAEVATDRPNLGSDEEPIDHLMADWIEVAAELDQP